MSDAPRKLQLQMVIPEDQLDSPPEVTVPEGYRLRIYEPGDIDEHRRVMHLAGFEGWNDEQMEATLKTVLPDGLFVVEHEASAKLVATAMAQHVPTDLHPFGGMLGWVAGDPEHKGKGLGMTVCAAATRRLIEGKYRRIYLCTDDWRHPALVTYLRLGYQPLLFLSDMEERWRAVYEELGWDG